MRISEPRVVASPLGSCRQRVVVVVVYENGSSEEYWIDVPEAAGGVSTSGNPWLVALLPLAATLGEPLSIDAPVDEILLENVRELLRVWSAWYPSVVEIEVHAEHSARVDGSAGKRVGVLFSGGVDSFYSLLRNREDVHPTLRLNIQDLVTVWGFDIPLADRAAFDRLRARFERTAHTNGHELLDVATNLRETRWQEANWAEVGHGCALAATCHAMDGRVGRVLIPSGSGYRDLRPWASHPLTDPLFSSSGLAVLHDGSSTRRLDKLAELVKSPMALNELRVCWRSASDRNCGACIKCIRTMIALELLGALDASAAFPLDSVPVDRARRLYCAWPFDRRELFDLRGLAADRGRHDMRRALDTSLRASRWRGRLLRALSSSKVAGIPGPLPDALERLVLAGWIR